MHRPRAGESSRIPFRKERFFCEDGEWFFEARGGTQLGPYSSKEDMEAALAAFIRTQRGQRPAGRTKSS